jgi:hyaluronoglucosaminidase
MARYVGIRKLESEKRNWLAIRSFDINPVTKEEYGVDNNPFTFLATNGEAEFALKPSTTRVTLLMGDVAEGARCTVYNAAGEVVNDVEVGSCILHLDVTNAATLKLSGVSSVYECVEQ